MNKEDQFYIVLPSNSNLDVFADNSTSCFTVKLAHDIRLRGRWEVGLSEIHFPHTFLHLSEKNSLGTVEEWLVERVVIDRKPYKIPHGLYEDEDDFLEKVNEVFSELNISFKRHPDQPSYLITQSTCFNSDDKNCVLCIDASRALLKMLGFESSTKNKISIINGEPVTASRPARLLNALPRQLFVYTDISEPVCVGNVRSSLLSIVPVNLKNYTFGNNQYQTFAPVKYIPLMTDNLSTITIDIRDELGEKIPFEFGTLIATLHFRKIGS